MARPGSRGTSLVAIPPSHGPKMVFKAKPPATKAALRSKMSKVWPIARSKDLYESRSLLRLESP